MAETGSMVVVVPPVPVDGAGSSSDPTAGVAAVAALEQAGENAVTVEALRTLVERIATRFVLEITAITERVDALSAILMSAMEELDLEEEETEGLEEEIEEELVPEEAIVELSDTASTETGEETPEAGERHPDMARGTGNESGTDSGVDATESERPAHRAAPKSRQRSGPFGRH